VANIFYRNLPLLLLHAREHVIAHFKPILNAHGITEQQWRIVRALTDTGPLEPREIGVLCRISSPSLAGVLSRMDELDLIDRRRLKHDQRRIRVSLTRRSRALAARMAPEIEATYRRIQTAVGVELFDRLYHILDELIDLLSTESLPAPDE
jgi:homoprotocatechuate degradation regulator HpaR